MTEQQCIPRPFRVLSAAVFGLGALCLALTWTVDPPRMTAALFVLVAAALLAENFGFTLPQYSVSLAYPLTIAAIPLAGPAAAGLVAALVATNYREIRNHRPVSIILFNIGQLVFLAVAGGRAYFALGGTSVPWLREEIPHVLIPMVAVAVICGAGNLILTAGAVAILRSESPRALVPGMFAFLPTQLALAFVGFLIAQVLSIEPLALPLFIAPLAVARQVYQRYAGLKDAFVDTVRSLVGALEAKDPYTRGHSERVSEYAVALSRALHVGPRDTERLEYAALLHDIGKLAVPSAILVKPGRLEPQEMELIREHPGRGSEMIGRIPPLRDLAEAVAQHHEWFDGAGYPNHLEGAQVALTARILAVADSYDAMTTTRAYRPALSRDQAVAELISGAGTQFDPEVVRIFIDARIDLVAVEDSTVELSESLSQPASMGTRG